MTNLENGTNQETLTTDMENDIDKTGELKKYQSYLNGDFKTGALDFLYKCGLLTETMYVDDPDKFISKVDTQMNQIKEELGEVLEAIDLDAKEHMDGHVDSMFVVLNFLEMNKYLGKMPEAYLEENLNLNKLQMIGNIFDHIISYPLPKEATDENMLIAARRIVENNALKYTNDKEVAKSWKIPTGGRKEGIHLQEVEYQGVVYYSLVDSNGKIRKHKDFKAVDLSDLVDEV